MAAGQVTRDHQIVAREPIARGCHGIIDLLTHSIDPFLNLGILLTDGPRPDLIHFPLHF